MINGAIVLVIVCLLVALWAHMQMKKVPGYSNPQEFNTNVTNYGLFDMARFISLALAAIVTLMIILDHYKMFDR